MFETMSALDVVEFLLHEWGGSYETMLHSSYATRRYCCQFNETDFNFFTRLLDDEGIFYYFQHRPDEQRLVLADKTAFDAMGQAPKATYGYSVTHWSAEYSVHAGQYAVRDFDEARAEVIEGKESTLVEVGGNDRLRQAHYPAGTSITEEARRRARVGIEREECRHAVHRGVSYRHDFCAGGKFSLQEHTDDRLNVEYLLTSVQHSFDLHHGYRNSFTCIPHRQEIAFRPPRTAAKPKISGPQTAIVVKEPPDPEHIGAVRVRFHWFEQSSPCWVRFAEMAAGRGWGTWFPPRIDEEVIVEFLNGDPDRPVITGRLYNGRNRAPETEPHVTLIKTAGEQELRFDDQFGQERLVLKAARDMEIISENGELTIQDGAGNRIHISAQGGISIAAPNGVKIESGQIKLASSMVTIDAAMIKASGVLQCDMLIANSVVSASYTPGAGNIW
jgi:type VI secretion system secreted protein VgrG